MEVATLHTIAKMFAHYRSLKDWDGVDAMKQLVPYGAIVVLGNRYEDGVEFKIRNTGVIKDQFYYDKDGNLVDIPSRKTIFAAVTGAVPS